MSNTNSVLLPIMTDTLAFLVPSAIVIEKYSSFFFVLVGIDGLILVIAGIIILFKREVKSVINREIQSNNVESGLFWVAGAIIWSMNSTWSGVIIWMMVALLSFAANLLKIKRLKNT